MDLPNKDWALLTETFRRKLRAIFDDLEGHGLELSVVEGFRSVKRQQWLYAQGRTRSGPIVTQKDGIVRKSNHQSGNAADVIFVDASGHRYWPPLHIEDGMGLSPEWDLLSRSAKAHEVTWGGLWKMRDTPHLELTIT